jgi:hypothetical protein
MFGKNKTSDEPPPRRFLENFPCKYCNATGKVDASDLICRRCMHDNHFEPSKKKKKMKPFDFTAYTTEREEGLKLFCSVCGQRFGSDEEYVKHHLTTCSGKGS